MTETTAPPTFDGTFDFTAAAPLRDLVDIFDPDLYLPIRGVQYRVHCPSRAERIRLGTVAADTTMTIAAESDEIEKVLGDALAKMEANGVPSTAIDHAGRTAITHFGIGAPMGRAFWHFAFIANQFDPGSIDLTPDAKNTEAGDPA